MTEPIVEIADVYPDTVRVPLTDLQAGDLVHDAYGRRYEVLEVRVTANYYTAKVEGGHRFHYVRDGGTITIVRKA